MTRKVIREAQPWTPIIPRIVDQALGNAIHTADADTVGVELNAAQSRVGAGNNAGTVPAGTQRDRVGAADVPLGVERGPIGRVVQVGIEVRGELVGLVGMRNAIPADRL